MRLARMISITRSIVAPSPNGPPRNCGVMRKTLIEANRVVQLYFVENSKGKFGRLVGRRVVTQGGVSAEQTFDPPLLESKLPPVRTRRIAIEH